MLRKLVEHPPAAAPHRGGTAHLDLADPVTALGGAPFLDDSFASGRLLAAVAAVRHVEAEKAGMADGVADTEVGAWLMPARVFMLRRDAPPIPAVALTSGRRQLVAAAVDGLAVAVPPWGPLVRLPVRFALLEPANGAISASSRAWPQHVLLADDAFAVGSELAQQVLHELCHQWLYLVEEIWALDVPGSSLCTLPSGTANRTPAEVLGAAHVAATLVRWHRASAGSSSERVDSLSRYGHGCLEILDDHDDDLTDAGRHVALRIKEAL